MLALTNDGRGDLFQDREHLPSDSARHLKDRGTASVVDGMERSFTFGPELQQNAVLLHLWAPLAESVRWRIETRGEWMMPATGDRWKLIEIPNVKPGDRYSFILTDGHAVPRSGLAIPAGRRPRVE